MFLIFPLGIFYFVVMVTFISVSLALMFQPLLAGMSSSMDWHVLMPLPMWFHLLTALLGFVMLTWSLHLVRLMAKLQGVMTKALLIRR